MYTEASDPTLSSLLSHTCGVVQHSVVLAVDEHHVGPLDDKQRHHLLAVEADCNPQCCYVLVILQVGT